MIRALLIDDENHCNETLRYELQRHCPEIEVIGSALSGLEGIELIHLHNPDLVFLDVEMPGMSGFEMLKTLGQYNFKIIFITAYDQFAVQAFRFAAVDYLLKPVMSKLLTEAIHRIKESWTFNFDFHQLNSILASFREGSNPKKIALPSSVGIDFIDIADIIYVNSDGNYCKIITKSGLKYTSSRTLKDMEELLHGSNFFRVHQSFLIQLNYIKKYLREDNGIVVMLDGTRIPIAKRRKEEFLNLIK